MPGSGRENLPTDCPHVLFATGAPTDAAVLSIAVDARSQRSGFIVPQALKRKKPRHPSGGAIVSIWLIIKKLNMVATACNRAQKLSFLTATDLGLRWFCGESVMILTAFGSSDVERRQGRQNEKDPAFPVGICVLILRVFGVCSNL